jgi:hypothetical protein
MDCQYQKDSRRKKQAYRRNENKVKRFGQMTKIAMLRQEIMQ